MAGVEVAVHPRRRHIFFTGPFPAIPGPGPLTADRRSGFYFRKEMEQVLLSAGDVQDIGAQQTGTSVDEFKARLIAAAADSKVLPLQPRGR